MVDSRNIVTPQTTCPPSLQGDHSEAEDNRRQLDRVFLRDILKSLRVEEKITMGKGADRYRRYVIRLELLKRSKRKPEAQHCLLCGCHARNRAYITSALERSNSAEVRRNVRRKGA